jgi:glycosyltransferase involved in cell wall biosynthesis
VQLALLGNPVEVTKALPTVSVCIPCIPIHVQYLDECLSSISEQDVLPEEVILTVSESTPFVEKYVMEKISPFIEKLHIIYKFFPEKRCTGSNRAEAIKLASGDIIVSMNADDIMFLNKINVVKTIFYQNPSAIGLLHYFVENIKKDNMLLDESPLFHGDLVQPYSFEENKLHFGHASFKRSLFDKYSYQIGISEEPGMSDVALIEEILLEEREKLLVYKKPLVSYMSIRSSFLNDYSKRMYDLFLYKLYTQHKPMEKNTSPSVSVCIPCIPQHIEHLYDCFLSIANQTDLPEEVILVISDANPLEEIQKQVMSQVSTFTEKLNIKFKFVLEKQYAGTNRNDAMELASGDIIALIDADDMMCEGRITRIKEVFSRFPFAVCMLHHFIENVYSPIHTIPFNPDIIEAYIFNDKLHCGHACFRRSVFPEISYTSKRRGQDVEFIKKLLIKYRDKIIIDPEPLTLYISDRSSFYHMDTITNDCLPSDGMVSPSSNPILPSWDAISKSNTHINNQEPSQKKYPNSETDSNPMTLSNRQYNKIF